MDIVDHAGERASDVLAVLVTYKPQINVLRDVICCTKDQVGRILLFDNATPDITVSRYLDEAEVRFEPDLVVNRSPANVGLGAAINFGAKYAEANGFNYLLLLDQDSLPDRVMVATLKFASQELQKTQRVAAVGPQFRDSRNGCLAPFVRIGFPSSQKLMGGPGQTVACDFLISSGTLLPLECLPTIGPMDEGLFIDNIDLDWCFRAKYCGFGLFGICDATMQHSIGDSLRPSRLKRAGITVHQPFRLYYIMRNRLLLYRRRATPKVWIAQDIPRLFLKTVSTLLFLSPRHSYLSNILRGLMDGIRGVSGAKRD